MGTIGIEPYEIEKLQSTELHTQKREYERRKVTTISTCIQSILGPVATKELIAEAHEDIARFKKSNRRRRNESNRKSSTASVNGTRNAASNSGRIS